MSDDEGPPLFPGPEHRFPGPPASDGSAFAGEDGNFDGWEDDEGVPTWSLVRPRVLCDSAGFAMLHDVQTHGFDLRRRCDELRLDSLARIRLVNWIRSGEEGARGVEEIAGLKGDERWLVEGEEWLKPVIEDDGMLQIDLGDEEDEVGRLRERVADLESQLASARAELTDIKRLVAERFRDEPGQK